jgi:hypothetical protein
MGTLKIVCDFDYYSMYVWEACEGDQPGEWVEGRG